jgi:thiol-disulfide isomerase/thioredoxin
MKRIGLFLVGFLMLVCGCGKPSRAPAPTFPSKVGERAPELDGGTTWLNTSPVRLDQSRGKVVLLEFYDYSCVNCLRTFLYLKEWNRRYAAHGLVTVGVHTPQYGFSASPLNVHAANKRLGVDWPVVVDSEWAIANVYSNRYWPRILIIDKDGWIRFDQTGEGRYLEAEQTIQQLLTAIHTNLALPAPMSPVRGSDRPDAKCYPITAELYLGTGRGKLGNPEAAGVSTNAPMLFRLPAARDEGVIYAAGEWSVEFEYMRHTRDVNDWTDGLYLKYRAVEVNVVMKPEDVYWKEAFIRQDGKWLPQEIAGSDILYDEQGRSYVKVNSPRMYNLIAFQEYGLHELELLVLGKGLSVYSFAFGTCEIPVREGTVSSGQKKDL